MSAHYTFYRVLPGSVADGIVKSYLSSREAMVKAAKKFADENVLFRAQPRIGGTSVQLLESDGRIVGYQPMSGMPWEVFQALFDAAFWSAQKDKHHRWIAPSKPKKKNSFTALCTAWCSLPVAETRHSLAAKLVGSARFIQGCTMYSMVANFSPDMPNVVGIPWLATRGVMGTFGGKFTLAEGLEPMNYEDAMRVVYADELKEVMPT